MFALMQSYPFLARISPALLATVGPFCAVVAVREAGLSWETPAAGSVLVLAIAWVVSGAVRDAGRRVEKGLLLRFDGLPTTLALRWRDCKDSALLERRRARLKMIAPDIRLIDADAERANPALADQRIDEAVAVLRERARDSKSYPVLFSENCAYGFRRNLLALRPWALALIALAAAAIASLAALDTSTLPRAATAGAALFVMAALWLSVRPEWVWVAADRYAVQLLRALDALPTHHSRSEESLAILGEPHLLDGPPKSGRRHQRRAFGKKE